MKQKERNVRKEVIEYLRKRGHTVFPHDTKARLTSHGTFAAFSPLYATAGEADIECFHHTSPASPVWIELKKPGKRTVDPDQGIFRRQVQELGHEYCVVQSVEDLVKLGF